MDKQLVGKAFGRVLRQARLAAAISQESLALESGIDRSYISILERGVRQPSLALIFAISPTLRVSPSQLVERTARLMTKGGVRNR